jgi:hypothetical protein
MRFFLEREGARSLLRRLYRAARRRVLRVSGAQA